jgi:hypothetical protein
MTTKKNRIELAKKIIFNLKREMQKPQLTASVRNERDRAALIVKSVYPRMKAGPLPSRDGAP